MAKKDELEELKKKVEELEKEKEKKEEKEKEDEEDFKSSIKFIEWGVILILIMGFLYFVDRGSFNQIIRGIENILTWNF